VSVNDNYIRFVPSRVLGADKVKEVVIRPDKLELFFWNHDWAYISFETIAQWPKPIWFWKAVHNVGWRSKFGLCVGERDWFHAPRDRFFTFYSEPRITIFMADEPLETDYGQTLFFKVKGILSAGGYCTRDLG